MHLLSVDRVRAEVEGRTLFSEASFGLSSTDRVGLVGPNGSGKTTLLRIIAQDRAPDGGQVVTRTNLRVGWLPQEPDLPAASAQEVVLEGDPMAGPHEADALLERLNVDPRMRVDAASGGQRRRVALARTLLAPSDLLVLDEPTNHLDVDTIDWLEAELARRATGLVIVTHDRYVLERVANRMIDLAPVAPGEPAEVRWHEGSYSSLLEARAERAATRERVATRARGLLTKEVAWLRRQPKARTSKPRFRIEQVEALREAASGDAESMPLELGTGRTRLGDDVIDLAEVSIRRGEHQVLDRVSLGIGPGERLGIVGPNGAGKSTLLHVIAGTLPADAGTIKRGVTVQLGVYEQQDTVPPDASITALDTILAIAPHVPLANGQTLPAHRLAERFGFDSRQQRTPVSLLSGGERRRLKLLHLLVAAPNVLLLDEPTNDLDLDTLAVLEDHLDGFTGTIVVASHDRFLLDRLTDRTIAVEDGRLTEYLDVASYRDARAAQLQALVAATTVTPTRSPSARDNAARQAARKQARSLEQRIERLTRDRARLHEAMIEAAKDPEELLDLQRRLHALEAELSEAEDTWLELTVDEVGV
ncbi:MAG: ABC-F family ATP-binding cassette domain-containing protein [Nitriliruptoraceae bacterium]|nr:ABC-F family ATP-binding cassette domain-containing protein [Nitriliruptoraceae bacterium]